MKKGGKIAIGIISTIGVGVGIYFLGTAIGWWGKGVRKKGGKLQSKEEGNIIDNVVDEVKKISRSTTYPKTPFANEEEGNKFRAWVNNTHPSYAAKIDLDATGAYDNSYIRKAYKEYGSEYKASNAPPQTYNILDIATQLGSSSGYKITKDGTQVEYTWGNFKQESGATSYIYYPPAFEAIFTDKGNFAIFACKKVMYQKGNCKGNEGRLANGKWSNKGKTITLDNGTVMASTDLKSTLDGIRKMTEGNA